MTIPFSKYSGCGNDFVLIDNRLPLPSFFDPAKTKNTVRFLSDRKEGIGADGVILLENSKVADYKMRIFNSDGSEAEMCGNGLRCLGKFIEELDGPFQQAFIETMKSTLLIEPHEKGIKAEMGAPSDILLDLSIPLNEVTLEAQFLNTGVPHAVIFRDDLKNTPSLNWGREIRYHEKFSPRGTNVNFVKVLSPQMIEIDTYERGVEGLTLACGTGATASALAASLKFNFSSPITVKTRSNEHIEIIFEKNSQNKIISTKQIGPVKKHFQGLIQNITL